MVFKGVAATNFFYPANHIGEDLDNQQFKVELIWNCHL